MRGYERKTERPFNALTDERKYKLMKYIDNNKDYATKNTAAKIASELSAKLGFTVSTSNVNSARQNLGINSRGIKGKNNNAYAAAYKIIAVTLANLHERLGEDVPDDLEELIKKFSN